MKPTTNLKLNTARLVSSPRWVIVLLLLLAFFLRVYRLNGHALRGDEAATVLYSAIPVGQLWELSRITDPHPPLYYLLLHPWQWLAGESAWAMRFAGVTAAVLAVAVLYSLARRTLHRTPAALLAAGLLAVNPFQIWLAQDIRSYPFFALLGLLSSAALWQALNRTGASARRGWAAYVILTVACLYIHYYTVFLIAFQGLFVLLNLKQFWAKKWVWLASQAAIGLLIIPGLQLAYNFIGPAAGGIDTIPLSAILRRTFTALLTGFTIAHTWGAGLSLLLAPVWLAGLVILWRRNALSGTFWTLFFAAPVLGVVALSINRPFFKERFFIQAQPAFELLLAAGLVALWQAGQTNPKTRLPRYLPRFLAAGLLAILLYANALALTNYFSNPVYAKAPPWQLYRDYVAHEARPGDVMLTNFPEAAVSYYSPNHLPFYVVPAERDLPVEARLSQTEQIAGAYSRIWFLPLLQQGFDEQGDVLNWLNRHADRVNQVFFPGYNINLYLSPPAIEKAMVIQPATFAHGLHLRGFQIFNAQGDTRLQPAGNEWVLSLRPEDSFTLSLYWQAGGPTPVDYTVFTHLVAADGFNRTGQDNQPVWGTYPTTTWQPGEKITDKYTLTIPPGTPPGDHRLQIGWYRPDTQARVPVVGRPGQPPAESVTLKVIIRVE